MMKHKLRYVWSLLFVLLALSSGLMGGVGLERHVLAQTGPSDAIPATPAFRLIAEAWNTIEEHYVDRSAVEMYRLAYGAIGGMVDALGDTGHSRFMDPETVQQQENYRQGEFEGIGAYVEMRDGQVVIVAPIDNSPAQRAGIRPGDVIVAVDGLDVAGMELGEVTGMVLGPAGTEVTLTLLDPESGETREVTLVRARIELDIVTWHQLPGTDIAHVRISAFSQGVSDELIQALSEIQEQGLTGVILDLRDNPGGFLHEAVGVTSQFINEGDVLLRQDAQGNVTGEPVRSGGVALDIPLVVLINAGSASASEIVSGALQEHSRATLVGETTFGTGTVLNEFRLSDGSAMLLAVEQWLTPEGRVIWHQGIEPNIAVTLPEDIRPVLPDMVDDMTAEELAESGDEQLLRAVEMLTGVEYAVSAPIASPGADLIR